MICTKCGKPIQPGQLAVATDVRETNARHYSCEDSANMPTQSIGELLAERGKQYGDFTGHAVITQHLKEYFRANVCNPMSPVQWEALDMIAHKIGRILNGNPNHKDSWDDIAGYSKLAADRCKL